MKKLKIECKNCNYIMTLEGEDPEMAFQYLTNSNKKCKHCGKPLVFSRSDNNDFKKVCPRCNRQTLSYVGHDVWSCESDDCTYAGKPIPKL